MPRRRTFVAVALTTVAGIVLIDLHGLVFELIGALALGVVLALGLGVTVIRLGPESQPDREREALAREEFDRTGHWPSE